MFRFLSARIKDLCVSRGSAAVLAIVLVSLGGCARMNLRGESFNDDDLSKAAREVRPREPNAENWGFSNKSRQIEGNLGIGR